MRIRPGLAALLLAACGQNFAEKLELNPTVAPIVALPLVDLRADVNRNGVIDLEDPTEDLNEDTWDSTHGAVFLANIDDDSMRCPRTGSDVALASCNDATDVDVNGDEDVLDLAPLKVAAWQTAPDGTAGRIYVVPPDQIRIFRKVEGGYALFDESTSILSTNDLRGGVELFVEGKDIIRNSDSWDGYVTITLSVSTPEKEVTDAVKMRISPAMLFHHLTPSETSYVTRVPGDPDSTSFVTSLRTALSQTLEKAPLVEVAESDLWTEDFFETGYMSMPAAGGKQHVVRVNFRSASIWQNSNTSPLRPAGKVVFTKFRGKDVAGAQAYTLQQDQQSESLNSYGNTETIPPFTFGDKKYPLGRIIRGSIPSFAPDPVMSKVFESQAVQPVVYIDTSWLAVGHVDESISFLKAPNARGWVLLLNDPALAKQMLEAEVAKGNGGVQMHVGKSWYNMNTGAPFPATISISGALADTDVMGRSATAAAEIEAQLTILKAETGITEAEIIRVPFLHHTEYGYAIAYQPGFVNGFVAGDKDMVAPDPFGPIIDGKDIFKADFEQKLSAIGYNVRWIDDWDLYHVNMGEVHCGTNTSRKIPDTKWWESGR